MLTSLLMILVASVTTSEQAASDGRPLKVCLVSGSEEYESDKTLAAFQKYLEGRYSARCTLLKATKVDDLPGLDALDDCDVALFFTRRLTIDGEQLASIRKYVESGRPFVGVRTASHGFQNWLEFDKTYLGGNYANHFKNGVVVHASVVPEAKDHPIVAGLDSLESPGSLYRTAPLAADCTPLLIGTNSEGKQPAAWTREVRNARIFYTSLGAQGDFDNPRFLRLLARSLFWASRREIPDVAP